MKHTTTTADDFSPRAIDCEAMACLQIALQQIHDLALRYGIHDTHGAAQLCALAGVEFKTYLQFKGHLPTH